MFSILACPIPEKATRGATGNKAGDFNEKEDGVPPPRLEPWTSSFHASHSLLIQSRYIQLHVHLTMRKWQNIVEVLHLSERTQSCFVRLSS